MAILTESLSSTCISYVEYDDEEEILVVYFVKGGSYTYTGVPYDVFEELISAGSAGRYFYYNIRDIYG